MLHIRLVGFQIFQHAVRSRSQRHIVCGLDDRVADFVRISIDQDVTRVSIRTVESDAIGTAAAHEERRNFCTGNGINHNSSTATVHHRGTSPVGSRIDGNAGYTMESAVRMGHVLKDLDFEAFEEPMPQSPKYACYEELRRRLPLSLAAGEAVDSRADRTGAGD